MSSFCKRLLPILALAGFLFVSLFGAQFFRSASVEAQDTPGVCSTLVEAALETTDSACSGTGRNQVCYGNTFSELTARAGVPEPTFRAVGDQADLIAVDSLQLSELDVIAEQWGVVLMQAQANLPDTLPGQNVTFLLFGDVAARDLSDAAQPTADVTATTGLNIRLTPSETGAVLGSLNAGQSITATGLHTNSAGQTWAQVRYAPDRVQTGWVIAGALDGDLSALEAVGASDRYFGPMQAVYFQTGIGRPACVEAPVSGVLVQTPQGQGQVSFNSNGVEVLLGSTAFIQAQPGVALDFYLLEGTAKLSAGGVTQSLTPGMVSRVPLGEDGMANGTPGYPQAYALSLIDTLRGPMRILPRPITAIAPPATPIPAATATPAEPAPTVEGANPPPDTSVPCPLSRDVAASITFENTEPTGKRYRVYRLNQQCAEVFEGDLGAFGAFTVGTFAGHTWLVRDQAGREVARFTVPGGGGQHRVTVQG